MNQLTSDMVSHLQQAIEIARFAPSSHNCQPWQVKVGESYTQGFNFEVWFDQSRMLNSLPSLTREMYLGCGIFTEFLRQVLLCQGIITRTTWLDDPLRLVRVEVSGTQPPDHQALDRLTALIQHRRTVRSPYHSPPVPDALMSQTQHSASDSEPFNSTIAIHSGIKKMRSVAALVRYYAGLDFSNRHAWRETFRYIRFDETEAREDGFYFSNLFGQRSCWFRWAFRLGLHPRNHRLYSLLKLPAVMASNFAKLIGDEGHLMTLTVEDESPASLFSAGQALGEFLLTVQQAGWALHPLSVLVQHDEPRAQLSAVLDLAQSLVYVARLGQSHEVASAAPRRSTQSILASGMPSSR